MEDISVPQKTPLEGLKQPWSSLFVSTYNTGSFKNREAFYGITMELF
jgi:hypothetical protein